MRAIYLAVLIALGGGMASADEAGSTCRSYSYYPSNFILNPQKGTQQINIEESYVAKAIELFPNPNDGKFRLMMDQPEKVESIQAFDLRGRQLALNWDPILNQVQLGAGVKGYILLKVQTQHQVATFKILVK